MSNTISLKDFNNYRHFMDDLYDLAGSRQPTKLALINAYVKYLDSLVPSTVSIEELGKIVMKEQAHFVPNLTLEEAVDNVNAILNKRQVQFAFLTAIQNDIFSQFHLMLNPLQNIIFEDRATYGSDEQLALEIADLNGTIGITNFGYLDRHKQGFIAELDALGKTDDRYTTTFIDDIFSAIVAAAEARLAHLKDEGHN